MEDVNAYLIQRFGMTADAIMRVMRTHKRIVNSEVHETVRHADFYINPTDYCDPTDLPLRDWEEKDDDDDGYPNLYLYADDLFGEDGTKVFKDLISRGTLHGGMGSALEAMALIDAERTHL